MKVYLGIYVRRLGVCEFMYPDYSRRLCLNFFRLHISLPLPRGKPEGYIKFKPRRVPDE